MPANLDNPMSDLSRTPDLSDVADETLLPELRTLIADSRRSVAQSVNSALVALYWQIGHRLYTHVLSEGRAEYGKRVVADLGRQLAQEFGRGFNEKNLRRMIQFAQAFPEEKIVAALRRQLGWTHFKTLLPLPDPLQRSFYAEMCRLERWSTRTLQEKINGMLYERTALSKKPAVLVEQELARLRAEDRITPDLVFKDPYVLDFLGLRDTFSESDLESALLREIERFLLELGSGFAFLERQKRIVVDGEDFYLDLLFFHRRLHRLVLVELKLGSFQAADYGQVQLYLRWLDKHERQPGEEPPIGLILCAGKSEEKIELLELEQTGMRVAQYLTELPPREILRERLQQAIAAARVRVDDRRRR